MNYNFETISSRYTTGSKKWAEIHQFCPGLNEDIIPFSVADMEFETAPEIRDGLKKYIDQYVLGYANPTDDFLSTVCDWMKRRHNWDVKADWILGTAGIITAMYQAVQTYTKPGEGVMLLTPVYYPMYSSITSNGRKLVDCPLVNNNGRYEINFEDFEKKAADENTRMFILCSPHNPSSRVWTVEELSRMAEICLKHHVLVLSDEIHFDLIMPGHQHHVFATISKEIEQNCIICTAPSKSFNLAGLQTSNIIIPNPELREMFHQHELTLEMNPKCNVLGYEANRLAYRYCEDWLDQAVEIIYRNSKLVTNFFETKYPEIRVTPLEGTYLLWMDFNGTKIPYRELAETLRTEAHLFFDDGYIFGAQGEGFERWNLACPTRYIEEGLDRLDKYLQHHLSR